MPREESEYLLDMVLAARKAVSFTEGMSFADFAQDERTVFSATKAVEIVGEAAAQVSEDARRENPDIPWRDIIAMRNRLVHAYFEINLELVWQTVRHDPTRSDRPIGATGSAGVGIVPSATIGRLIVNSPYEEPARRRRYDRVGTPLDVRAPVQR